MVIRNMLIGVMAIQGDFEEHCSFLVKLGVDYREVRLPEDLNGICGLILPGGESTTFGKIASDFGLIKPLREKSTHVPFWGTCAGLVFMAGDVGLEQPILKIMDIKVERNAFGRQVDSFEQDLEISGLEGGLFPGVFIRAPVITSVGPYVETLSKLGDGRIVAVLEGRHLATSFHPELTRDYRLHEYFLRLCSS
jgi:pyridoxal 5'-phosphate synthase pdxT subunit